YAFRGWGCRGPTQAGAIRCSTSAAYCPAAVNKNSATFGLRPIALFYGSTAAVRHASADIGRDLPRAAFFLVAELVDAERQQQIDVDIAERAGGSDDAQHRAGLFGLHFIRQDAYEIHA